MVIIGFLFLLVVVPEVRIANVIGENVERLRIEQEITKDALARMSGMSRPTLDKIEDGFANTGLAQVQGLIDALCVEPNALLASSQDASKATRDNLHGLQL